MSAYWEYKDFSWPRDTKRNEVRAFLTSMAETERWEIDRVRVWEDGRRWVRLRRKAYLLQRTA